ncbi:hypothetical protein J6590_087695 [Homalodisca vitripennis]|nr:hypothetical protein J6590_087695 [Homalodisca vitripennis]
MLWQALELIPAECYPPLSTTAVELPTSSHLLACVTKTSLVVTMFGEWCMWRFQLEYLPDLRSRGFHFPSTKPYSADPLL